jgi:hypothetical protein
MLLCSLTMATDAWGAWGVRSLVKLYYVGNLALLTLASWSLLSLSVSVSFSLSKVRIRDRESGCPWSHITLVSGSTLDRKLVSPTSFFPSQNQHFFSTRRHEAVFTNNYPLLKLSWLSVIYIWKGLIHIKWLKRVISWKSMEIAKETGSKRNDSQYL